MRFSRLYLLTVISFTELVDVFVINNVKLIVTTSLFPDLTEIRSWQTDGLSLIQRELQRFEESLTDTSPAAETLPAFTDLLLVRSV